MNKTCTMCFSIKPVSEFYKHSMTADGLYPTCKQCHCRKCKDNRQKDIKTYRKKQRDKWKTEKGREAAQRIYKTALVSGEHTRRSQEWRAKNPEKYQAHLAVKKALYHNNLKKSGCVVCGEKAHAHHEDYSRPLEVVWLCVTHHAEHHMEKRNGKS